MRLKKLTLQNFGVFNEYEVDFPTDNKACVLLTGKNNAGKTTIIRGLKLISSALKFSSNTQKPITRQLLKKDVPSNRIERLIHEFKSGKAKIEATFDNDKIITVTLDSKNNTAICNIPAFSRTLSNLFGFIPPLGQLVEQEQLLTKPHILDYLDTTVAPHHLRNHLYQLFSPEDYTKVCEIIRDTWDNIILHPCKYDISSNLLTCVYSEGVFYNEISWAGQGLQIWLQLVTHLVRLSAYPIIFFDEPEIFLHPKKQHDLIRLIQEYYPGCSVIATHSPELINNSDISHIIYVHKDSQSSLTRKTSDRNSLDKIRRNIGSSFNMYVSQFEDVELLIATEHQLDYDIIKELASQCGMEHKTQNVRLNGFTSWNNSVQFRDAYNMYFGKPISCSVLLDRDYYPQDYLDDIKNNLHNKKIRATFTPGKEIENIFLEESFLGSLVPKGMDFTLLQTFLNQIYSRERETCKTKYVEFARDHSPNNQGKTYSTVHSELSPIFESRWKDKNDRHNLIAGKNTLAEIRDFFRVNYHINLTTSILITKLASTRKGYVSNLLSQIF